MRLGILTRSLPPYPCGIGDHTVHLASSLSELGHGVVLIAGRGEAGDGRLIVGDDYSAPALERLRQAIAELDLDHLILQYTPLMYRQAGRRGAGALPAMWQAVGARLPTSLIVHETYFRSWRWPPSLLRGTSEKLVLRATCRASHHVFTASEPLVAEMAQWGLKRRPLTLPISSNIPLVPADKEALRARHGIAPNTLVLTLFGGGNNLNWCLGHVLGLERRLQEEGIALAWLLLGGVPRDWLPAGASVLDPGRLPLAELSAYMQMTDVFLMPNWCGVNAKRGTLMAAMEHLLPVVGTRGYMTDARWAGVEGVVLVEQSDVTSFGNAVVGLARDPQRRRQLGQSNQEYFKAHFTWNRIAQRLLVALRVVESVP